MVIVDLSCPWELYLFASCHLVMGLVNYLDDTCMLLTSESCTNAELFWERVHATSLLCVYGFDWALWYFYATIAGGRCGSGRLRPFSGYQEINTSAFVLWNRCEGNISSYLISKQFFCGDGWFLIQIEVAWIAFCIIWGHTHDRRAKARPFTWRVLYRSQKIFK